MLDGLGTGAFADILREIPGKLIKGAANLVTGWFDDVSSTWKSGDRSVGGNEALVRTKAMEFGWDGRPWDALKAIINKESGFDSNAQNPTSTAYGMFQFLDSTWRAVGAKKTSDPAAQTDAGLRYIMQRYGTPEKALAFHNAHGWYSKGGVVPDDVSGAPVNPGITLYDTGGIVPPGISTILNLTGQNETAAILKPEQLDFIRGQGGGGDDNSINVDLDMLAEATTPAEVASELLFELRKVRRGGKYQRGQG
jgi:hypothetical protein